MKYTLPSLCLLLLLAACKGTVEVPDNNTPSLGDVGDPSKRYLIRRTERDTARALEYLRTSYILDSTSPLGTDRNSTYVLHHKTQDDTVTIYFDDVNILHFTFDGREYQFFYDSLQDSSSMSYPYHAVTRRGDTVSGAAFTTIAKQRDSVILNNKRIACYRLVAQVSGTVFNKGFLNTWSEQMEVLLAVQEGIPLRIVYEQLDIGFVGVKVIEHIEEEIVQILSNYQDS